MLDNKKSYEETPLPAAVYQSRAACRSRQTHSTCDTAAPSTDSPTRLKRLSRHCRVRLSRISATHIDSTCWRIRGTFAESSLKADVTKSDEAHNSRDKGQGHAESRTRGVLPNKHGNRHIHAHATQLQQRNSQPSAPEASALLPLEDGQQARRRHLPARVPCPQAGDEGARRAPLTEQHAWARV